MSEQAQAPIIVSEETILNMVMEWQNAHLPLARCGCPQCKVWRYLEGRWTPTTIDEFIELANGIPSTHMLEHLRQLKAGL